MGIVDSLLGDQGDEQESKVALVAALDAKKLEFLAQLRSLSANAFLDPCTMNDVMTDYIKSINDGVPSDKA